MESAWDASAKYKYSEHSTIHNPQEIGEDANIHTWTIELNGQSFRVTREAWEAFCKYDTALREAGEKIAELLGEDITDDQLTEALEAWKSANK